MASKYGAKSKIPVKDPKKEFSSKTVGKTLTNSKQIRPLENKEKTTVEKKICCEMSSEVKYPKANAEKVTTKEKAATTKKALQQNPIQGAVGSTFKTLSKEIINQLKTEKLHDYKSNTEAVDNGGNVFSEKTDGIVSKPISGERKATSPSLIVQPKKNVPHGGLMFKPKKSAGGLKPFHLEPSPAKLRRSQSEYDPDFERPNPENIGPQHKCINLAQKDKADQNMKPAKSSKHKELSSRIEHKFRKDTPVQSKNPLVYQRMPKNVAAENKPARPLHVKSKPLRRSSTINAFDSARPKAENIRPQQKDMNIAKIYKADQKMKSSTLSKNKEESSATAKKIQKKIPAHPNNPLVPQIMSKNLSEENKPAKPLHSKPKPLRRSNTIHAFESVPVLNKAFGIRKKENNSSKKIVEQVSFENGTPGTPENLRLPQVDVEDIDKHLTPKKEMPHAGLVFKLHATRKGNENKLKPFANVD